MIEHQSLSIPLAKLVRSPLNVRNGERTHIDELARSILAQGVLQSLVVTKRDDKGKEAFEVAAGDRRLAALQLLRKQGKIKANFGVPCTLIPPANAVAASLTENVEREPMSPADEFLAFQRLVDEGSSIEDVAAAFGVTPLVVKRRLKLANVAPSLLALFRAEDIDLQQLMAFAITEDRERQENVWASLPQHSRSAHAIRAALTERELPSTDRLVRFVGMKAYEKAGGPVRVDLFTDDKTTYVQDLVLLRSLAQAKLDKKADQVMLEEGAAWAAARLDIDYAERSAFARVWTVRSEPTAKQAARLAKFAEQLAALEASPQSDGENDELDDQIADLREEIDDIEGALQRPDPRAVKLAGILLTVDPSGRVEIDRGLIRPADKKQLKEIEKAAATDTGAADAPSPQEGSGLSAALTLNLTTHFTAALRARVGASPGVAVRALTAALCHQVFPGLDMGDPLPVKVQGTEPPLKANAPEIADSMAEKEFRARHAAWEQRLAGVDDLFTWLLGEADSDVLALLAHCAAWSVSAISQDALATPAIGLAAAAGLDMRDYWQPTGEAFLKRVSKAIIVDALRQNEDPTVDLSEFESAKKADLVAKAAPILVQRKWLPALLRTEGATH
jgi:ParB family chromosome partitioning protein